MIKQLTLLDAVKFQKLIINMYSNLENLEWFTPMPYDLENVKAILSNPRFYVIGFFDKDTLCGVCSFDYKCGKLIGKIEFPKDCNTDKLVEIGFTMVHSEYKGNGIMKKMVEYLINKAKDDGFEWIFSKVHIDNLASSKSLIFNGFEKYITYQKGVNLADFKSLAEQSFFSQLGKINAAKTLAKISPTDTEIIANYDILIKQLI